MALDLIGQTSFGWVLGVEGEGRDADKLFHRDVWDFRNVLLVEQPNGDFSQTMMRQFLFDLASGATDRADRLWRQRDRRHRRKSAKVFYHLERSSDTVIGLGDGTEESRRMQAALDLLALCG